MSVLYPLGQAVFAAVGRLYFRWDIRDPDRVPPRGAAVLAANHASYLDPPLIGAALPRRLHYLARASLFRHPLAAAILRGVNCVPVDRERGGAGGLKAILQKLREGNAILLFPEGTRTPDGQLHEGEAGIGLLVAKCGCPVVPIGIRGMYEAYGRHRRFPQPGRVVIQFGAPLDFSAVCAKAGGGSKADLKALYQLITEEIMKAIAQLCSPA